MNVDVLLSCLFLNHHGQRRTHPHLHISSLTIYNKATVDIPQVVKDSLRKFRFSQRNSGSAAIVIKINKAKLAMEVEEQYDNISIEELAEGTFTHNTLRGMGS